MGKNVLNYTPVGSCHDPIAIPFIYDCSPDNVGVNANFSLTVTGDNFHPDSELTVPGGATPTGATVWNSPTSLTRDFQAGATTGLFKPKVINACGESDDSFTHDFEVTGGWVDLRLGSPDIPGLGLEVSTMDVVTIFHDPLYGMRACGTSNSNDRYIKFMGHQWDKADGLTFEYVFARTGSGRFYFGVCDINRDVDALGGPAFYQQEIGAYHNLNQINSHWGGGDGGNWSQMHAGFFTSGAQFYRVTMQNSGLAGSQISAIQVDPSDWDMSIGPTLISFNSTLIATPAVTFCPGWAVVGGSHCNYLITAFRVY